VSVADNHQSLIIRAYSATSETDSNCTAVTGKFCVFLEVRDAKANGNLVPLVDLVGLNANPLLVHNNGTTDDLSLALDDNTGTTFLFCKNGTFSVLQYDISRAGAPTCTGFTTSEWGSCVNGTQTRTVTSVPTGCAGGVTPPATTQTCTPPTSSNADLVVTGYNGPSGGQNNNYFKATVSIANRGTDPAGPFKVKVYIGRDVTLVGAQLVGTQSVSGLGAGQSATLSFTNLRFGGLAVHIWYTLTVVIDADTQVQESNENNNTFATSFYAM